MFIDPFHERPTARIVVARLRHFPSRGFTVKLQAIPLDAKIVCREIAEGEEPTDTVTPLRSPQPVRQGGSGRGRR